MNGPSTSSTSFPGAAEPPGFAGSGQVLDEDFPLGFECADPALQIERWSQEAEGTLPESH